MRPLLKPSPVHAGAGARLGLQALRRERAGASGVGSAVRREPRQKMTEKSETEIRDMDEMPALEDLPEIRIYSHSPIFYWWPVWLFGFFMAFWTWMNGGSVDLDETSRELILADSTLGMIFVLVLSFVIFVTNVTLRGTFSVIAILTVALISVVFAALGWWDDVLGAIPHFSVHANAGFYLVFSTILFLFWASMLFIFDRFRSWRIRPGQMTEQRLIGQSERSYDTRGLLFEQRSEDYFRHTILGLGAGDLFLITSGGRSEKIRIPNVLMVSRKVDAIQRLAAVQPDDLLDEDENEPV